MGCSSQTFDKSSDSLLSSYPHTQLLGPTPSVISWSWITFESILIVRQCLTEMRFLISFLLLLLVFCISLCESKCGLEERVALFKCLAVSLQEVHELAYKLQKRLRADAAIEKFLLDYSEESIQSMNDKCADFALCTAKAMEGNTCSAAGFRLISGYCGYYTSRGHFVRCFNKVSIQLQWSIKMSCTLINLQLVQSDILTNNVIFQQCFEAGLKENVTSLLTQPAVISFSYRNQNVNLRNIVRNEWSQLIATNQWFHIWWKIMEAFTITRLNAATNQFHES